MTTRRNFLKTGGLSLASLMVGQHSFARMAEKADDKLAGDRKSVGRERV